MQFTFYNLVDVFGFREKSVGQTGHRKMQDQFLSKISPFMGPQNVEEREELVQNDVGAVYK